jgi:hypothetical protein
VHEFEIEFPAGWDVSLTPLGQEGGNRIYEFAEPFPLYVASLGEKNKPRPHGRIRIVGIRALSSADFEEESQTVLLERISRLWGRNTSLDPEARWHSFDVNIIESEVVDLKHLKARRVRFDLIPTAQTHKRTAELLGGQHEHFFVRPKFNVYLVIEELPQEPFKGRILASIKGH